MVYCWSKQRQAWTRARRVNRCGGALTAPSRPTGTWRRDASPRSCSHRLSRVTGQHHLGERVGVPRNSPFASKDRRKQLLRVQPERNGKRKRDEARVPSQDRRISYTSVKRKARAESLIFAFRRAFLRLERKFRPRAKRGRLATRGVDTWSDG